MKFSSGVAGGAEPEELDQKNAADGKEKIPKPPRWKLEDVLKRTVDDVQLTLR